MATFPAFCFAEFFSCQFQKAIFNFDDKSKHLGIWSLNIGPDIEIFLAAAIGRDFKPWSSRWDF